MRIEGELNNNIEISAYLTDQACPGSMVILDLDTADASYVKKLRGYQMNDGKKVILLTVLLNIGGLVYLASPYGSWLAIALDRMAT